MTKPEASGCFVVIEGIDGSGSTTQVQRLCQQLAQLGCPSLTTCEPTAGPIGVMLRLVLSKRLVVPPRVALAGADSELSGQSRAPDYRTMALLFAADRADHNDVLIRPALKQKQTIISDRYVLSSLAYQSLTAPEGSDVLPWLKQINSSVEAPDLTVVLNVSADVAATRRAKRGAPAELFEVDALQRRLAAFYARAADVLDSPVCSIDADQDADSVAAAVFGAVEPVLRAKGSLAGH